MRFIMSRISEYFRRSEEKIKQDQLNQETRLMRNNGLIKLYELHRNRIFGIKYECDSNMKGPFLIAPNDTYWRSSTKVAFVGQQTNGWCSTNDITDQMKEYRDFDLARNYKSTPFWNVIRKLEKRLVQNPYSSAWLNLNRYDQGDDNDSGGGEPSEKNLIILSEIDYILLEELKLITPDIVIFFTAHTRDNRIISLLQGKKLTIGNFTQEQLCKIESPCLESLIFRTYHPKSLRLMSLEENVINAICTEVTQNK